MRVCSNIPVSSSDRPQDGVVKNIHVRGHCMVALVVVPRYEIRFVVLEGGGEATVSRI